MKHKLKPLLNNMNLKHKWIGFVLGKSDIYCIVCGLKRMVVIKKYSFDFPKNNTLTTANFHYYANVNFPCLTENEFIIKNIIE